MSALSLRQAATTAGLVEGNVPHRAMADARLTLDAFRHYIGRLAPRDPAEVVSRLASEAGVETASAADAGPRGEGS